MVQLADKGVSTAKMMKSFGQAFSKACAVEGAEPSSPPSDGEIPFSAFLFDNFFFAPLASKKKWLTNLYDLTNSLFMMRFVSSLNHPPSGWFFYPFFLRWRRIRPMEIAASGIKSTRITSHTKKAVVET